MKRPIAALIYDFDKTLSPRDMQEYSFLPGINVESSAFWEECRVAAVEHEMDGVLAYMYMMRKHAAGTELLTREGLNRLGAQVEFFPGVRDWFRRVNAIGDGLGLDVEHYIISSGLREIIEGTAIAGEFTKVFAASFVYDENGHAVWPATAVNYTSKTQYLFRINKGILDITNDRDLNGFTPESKRRVPFANMIYVGDGLTDVPCMKLTRIKGGYSVAVYAPDAKDTHLSDEMLVEDRVDFCARADYSAGSEMEKVVTLLLKQIAAKSEARKEHLKQYDRALSALGEPKWMYDKNSRMPDDLES